MMGERAKLRDSNCLWNNTYTGRGAYYFHCMCSVSEY